MLSDPQIERYSRQIILSHVGGKGQERLLHAKVLVAGDGPMQTQALLYLTAAGIGQIGTVGTARLPVLTALAPESQNSTIVALQRLNPDCTVILHGEQLPRYDEDLRRLVAPYDVVIAEPQVQLHAACYALQRPFVCGQAWATIAWLAVYRGYEENRPCFLCESPPYSERAFSSATEESAGSFVGTQLATEAMKIILGLNLTSPTKLHQYRFSELAFHDRLLVKNPTCSVCGQ